MPTLFRLVKIAALLGALGFAAIYALATFVTPEPREVIMPVPQERLNR
jgi:hypothetical protein